MLEIKSCSMHEKGESRGFPKDKPAEYLTPLKRPQAEKPVGLVAY